MFLFIPKILEQNQNFLMCSKFFLQKQNVTIYSKNFGTKLKLFDVFQLFFSKSKTLLFIPKILRSEWERFGLIFRNENIQFIWGR
jgi:hypothetical protein